MSSSAINYSPEFLEACRRLWRDGFDKGVNGEDDYPEFPQYFPDSCLPILTKTSSPQKKADVPYEELEKLPYFCSLYVIYSHNKFLNKDLLFFFFFLSLFINLIYLKVRIYKKTYIVFTRYIFYFLLYLPFEFAGYRL